MKPGDIVEHKLTKEKLLIIQENLYGEYRCRLNDMTISIFYQIELNPINET